MENRIKEIKENLSAVWIGNSSYDFLIRQDAEWLLLQVERLYKILHDLTPGGSEFYHDADRCAENIREQIDISRRIAKQTIRNSRSGWKPIEGAPRDGSEVILFDPEYGAASGNFADLFGWEDSEGIHSLNPTHYIEPPTTEQNS